MQYLRKEINKLLPLALLFGAIGGVLLIVFTNLVAASASMIMLLHGTIMVVSVFILNKNRFRKDTGSSILYGYLVCLVALTISYGDMAMNADPDFVNPVFESLGLFMSILFTVPLFSGAVAVMFRRKVIS